MDFGHGIASVLDSGARDWEFTISPLPSLVSSALTGSGSGQSFYDASRQIFPYPSTSFGLAFGTVQGIEVLANGFYWPQSLTKSIVDNISGLSSADPQFSATSFIVKVRKVLMHDVGPYPAMSLGLGGVYGDVKLGAGINFSNQISIAGTSEDMSIDGHLALETQVFGTGLEFDISKRLPVITPFANLGLWYRYAEVSMAPDASDPLTLSIGNGSTSDSIPIGASFSAVDQGVDARVGAGLEIRIWAVILHLSAAFDLEEPMLDISSLSLTGISANEFSLSTGIRYAF